MKTYFCGNLDFFFLWWIESLKEKHLFEMEIFCKIIFTVIFGQFNVSLLNKSTFL